ncbi:MAG: M28 family peptidase [bacterium]
MKKRILLIILILCVFNNYYAQENVYVTQIINSVKADSLMKYVNELSGNVPVNIAGVEYTITSRHKNSTTNNVAANYIKQKLSSYGLQVFDQNFSASGRNVYAVQMGTVYPDQKYIICAHYDDMPSTGLAPGSDDNASGTAAVIEAARLLSVFNTEYTIVYALFDEEEQGLVGSNYFATQARNNNEVILGVLNADMIAYDNNNDGKINIHTASYANSVTLANNMSSINANYAIGLVSGIYNPGSSSSDHASFWYKNYGAVLLIEDYYGSDFNAYYHTSNDKVTYFNIPYFIKCTKLIDGTLASLVKITGAVPVELISFTAEIEEAGISLRWATATEINNLEYEIQKSNDCLSWTSVGTVRGNGTSLARNNYSFIDYNPSLGNNFYRLIQKDLNGDTQIYGPVSVNYVPVYSYTLQQNYPNPFNPTTSIRYTTPVESNIALKVYDILGTEIAELVNETKSAGTYEVIFNSANINKMVSSGIYFYRLTAVDKENNKIIFNQSKQMILLK